MESDLPITAFTTTTEKPSKIADANANAVEEGEDIISNMLPESVITHILNFLPTKDAIRTSILSKKWERRWTSITKLSLHDYQLCVDFITRLQRMQNFAAFVNRALLLTDSLTMDHISLFLFTLYDWSLLNAWFSNIFKRRVKILQIHSFFQISFSVLDSHALFNNFLLLEELELLTDSISYINVPMYDEELKLLQNSVNSVDVPAPHKYILFGNLKILKLCGINFNTASPKSPRNIHLDFPLLTKFEAKNCAWFVDTSLVMINAPLLETISIEHSCGVPYKRDKSFICFPESEDLKEFSFCGYDISQNILMKIPCHASAKINLYESQRYFSYMLDFHAAALLRQFSHSKSIKFESSKVLDLNQMLPKKLCEFPMLTHLEVGFVSVEILLTLLQKSPVLETLVLKEICNFGEELLRSADVPKRLAFLHVVKFEEVIGDDLELSLAKYFLDNGRRLEKICFSISSQIVDKDEVVEEIKEKLNSYYNFIPEYLVEFSYD